MQVKALQTGYYGLKMYRPGEVFTLVEVHGHKQDAMGKLHKTTFSVDQQFSKHWMEKVDEPSTDDTLEDDINLPGTKARRRSARSA